MTNKLKIFNGRIITPFRVIPRGSVLIVDGKIAKIAEGDIEEPVADEIDAQGKFISPGFIDIHVHGGEGTILWMAM